ncbi:TonB-dependent receptor plug domain-containing protein [Flavobacterium silvaticum]|uniref:TonB-dependent receptor n=1 Tax=Flavobacterium silvaticum TaxID=1852020 RepID=A0A972FNR8_9FLAO|nr:TonB-dependent receptor plug domain-containing protein [Flavobacterium silvaticum]NMH29416.1 TonB-dependent receptor [Flavobacterium silvaticum]
MNEFRIWLIFLLFAAFGLHAQHGNKERIPLLDIIAEIEIDHKVRFSYLDQTIAGIFAIPPDPKLSLGAKIQWLRVQTGLEFDFSSPASITITKPIVFTPEQKDSIRIEKLEEVVVHQYLTSGISRKQDGATVISPPKFGLLPGLTEADVLQTMQQLPGITSVDETISNINIRGGTHDQNLFLWNGIRMFQTGHFFGQISAFNPTIPQKITVYKNGTPASLGESVSGTADIVTQTDLNAPDMAEIGANMIAAQAFVRAKLWKNGAVTISGRRSLTDFFDSPAYKSYSDRVFQNTVVTNLQNDENITYETDKDFYFYDLSLQLHQKIAQKHDFILSGILIENELAIDQRRYQDGTILSGRSVLQQSSWGTAAKYTYTINENTEIGAQWALSHFVLNGVNTSVQNDQSLSQQNEVLSNDVQIHGNHRFSETLSATATYEFSETSMENYDSTTLPDFERNEKRVMRSQALSGQANWISESGKWIVRPGLRLNYFGRARLFRMEPRLNSSYQIQNKLRLELMGEFKSQSAAQIIDLQQDFLGLEKRRWVMSNQQEIPIEKSMQASVGLIYEPENWLFTVESYYKRVTGIYSGTQSFQNQLEFEKIIGRYDIIGAEILAQRQWGKIRCWLSYSINHNDYTFKTYNPQQFPNNFHLANAATCAGIYESKQFKVALGAKWFTGKPQTYPIGESTDNGTILYELPNSSRLQSYFQMNLSATHIWQLSGKGQLSAGISIMNLLNTRCVINRYYRLDDTENIERIDTYSLGRTPNISLKFSI